MFWQKVSSTWYKLNLPCTVCVCNGVCTCVHAAWLSSLMDPCSFSDICDSCHQLATCKALNGSNNSCFCKHGYTGDGTTFCHGEYTFLNIHRHLQYILHSILSDVRAQPAESASEAVYFRKIWANFSPAAETSSSEWTICPHVHSFKGRLWVHGC